MQRTVRSLHHRWVRQLLVPAIERVVRKARSRPIVDDPPLREGLAAVGRYAEGERSARYAPNGCDASSGIRASIILLAELVIRNSRRAGESVAETGLHSAPRGHLRAGWRRSRNCCSARPSARALTKCVRRRCFPSGRRSLRRRRKNAAMPAPPSGTMVMWTQPIEFGTSRSDQLSPRSWLTATAAVSWLPVQRAPGRTLHRKSGSIQAPSSRTTTDPRTKLPLGRSRVRGGPERRGSRLLDRAKADDALLLATTRLGRVKQADRA